MRYLERLQKTVNEVEIMTQRFKYEGTNNDTEAKIIEEITQIFIHNEVFDKKYLTLEEAGWTVYIRENNGRFNNISVRLCVDLEMAFHFTDMTKD
jgi:hypothetical protein